MRQAAQAHGVAIIRDEVSAIDTSGGRISGVRLAGGTRIACDALVNGAGPWAGALAKLAGVALPVEPRKRTVYVIDCREPSAGLHEAPLTVDPSGVWFRPEGKLFLCGKSPEPDQEPPIGDLDVIDHGFFDAEVWPTLAARVPAFEAIKVVNAWAGYYDYNTLDQNAVIGPHPQLSNFYLRQRLLRPWRAAGRRRRPRRCRADRARPLQDHRSHPLRLRAHRRQRSR